MSADNIVVALPFQKMTGEVVWRVMECNFSGLSYEILSNMSTAARGREFIEFEGKNAAQQAAAAARRLVRSLSICEYGSSVAPSDRQPWTMEALRQRAIEDGCGIQQAAMLLEAPDKHLARLPLNLVLKRMKAAA